jgi:hypothetical protein
MRSNRRGKRRGQRPYISSTKTPSRRAQGKKARGALSDITSRVPALRSNPFWPPIKNALREKEMIEKEGREAWESWLVNEAQTTILMAPSDVALRTCEVYRLCFENSDHQELSILIDFVAHHPSLVFHCVWLEELVRGTAFVRHFDPYARNVLLALGSGFRRAGTKHDWKRLSRPSRTRAAHEVQKRVASELSTFLEGLDAAHAEQKWVAEQVDRKVQKLIEVYPHVATATAKLRALLGKASAYKASVLIAAKTFGVRERDLQKSQKLS